MYLHVHSKKNTQKTAMCNCSFLNFEGSLGVIELQIISDLHVYMYLHVIFFYMLRLQL